MSQISISTDWMQRSIAAIFQAERQIADDYNFGLTPGVIQFFNNGGPTWANARIHIMQGVMPSDLTSLTAINDRSADILMTFNTPQPMLSTGASPTLQDFVFPQSLTSTVSQNPVMLNSVYKAALASGTATWFRWMILRYTAIGAAPSSIFGQMIGSVSMVGGGGDLQMNDVNIVAGQQYKISGLTLQFPETFTF